MPAQTSDEQGVCLSVCMSVCQMRALWQNGRKSASAVPSSKKLTNINRKSTTRFPISLRWTSYVAPNQKRKTAVFHIESHFASRKSATKFLCVKTVSNKVLRHSSAYLFVRKWLVEDVPFYVKICRILTPMENADYQSIFARSTWAVTPNIYIEWYWMTLNGVIAFILSYFTEIDSLANLLLHSDCR